MNEILLYSLGVRVQKGVYVNRIIGNGLPYEATASMILVDIAFLLQQGYSMANRAPAESQHIHNLFFCRYFVSRFISAVLDIFQNKFLYRDVLFFLWPSFLDRPDHNSLDEIFLSK